MNLLKTKEEILKFVSALETNYADTIRGLKERNDKLMRQLRSAKSVKGNEASEKAELE
jgi:hypothetical protein